MNLVIHRIGRTRERWWAEAEQDYLRRLAPPWRIVLHEVKASEAAGPAQVPDARREEGERLIRSLAPRSHVIALDERGSELSSPQWARALGELMDGGVGEVEFLIGGAFGLDDQVRKRANACWALSRLTFPHQMARLILIEQLYRAWMIRQGAPYHK